MKHGMIGSEMWLVCNAEFREEEHFDFVFSATDKRFLAGRFQ